MENINNGKPIYLDFAKLPQKEQIKYAHEFSENSKALENILLFLWQNGINTCSSCAGHPNEGPFASPMISFNARDRLAIK